MTCQANLVAADTYLYLESFVASGIVYHQLLLFLLLLGTTWLVDS